MKINDWLRFATDQMAKGGLTDESVKPDDIECDQCGSTLTYYWHSGSTGISYWSLPNCRTCAENERLAAIARRLDDKMRLADVPTPLRELRPSNVPTDKFNEHMHRFASEWSLPDWVAICGPVGTGKTTWATALFNYLLERQPSDAGYGVWTTEAQIFHSCDVAHHKGDYNARQKTFDRYVCADILLIDDLAGSGRKLTDWQGGAMRHLFDMRHSRVRPTFLTTNMPNMGAISERYGQHVASRIYQMTKGLLFLGGPDRRMIDESRGIKPDQTTDR